MWPGIRSLSCWSTEGNSLQQSEGRSCLKQSTTLNYAAMHRLGRSAKRQQRSPYQRGAKPHDKGHLDITFHNPRAESPDYHNNVFVCLVYFVVDAMSIQPTRPELS